MLKVLCAAVHAKRNFLVQTLLIRVRDVHASPERINVAFRCVHDSMVSLLVYAKSHLLGAFR